MDRRHFVKVGGTGLAGLAFGCGGDGGPTDTNDSGNSGGIKNPFDSYTPLVNSQPYPGPDYSLARELTDSRGRAGFVDSSDNNKIYSNFFTENFVGGEISGLEVTLYKEYKYDKNTGFLLARDPQNRFMPELISLDNAPRFIEMKRLEDAHLRCDSRTFLCSLGGEQAPLLTESGIPFDLFIKEIIGPIPSYDFDDFDDLPGHLYIGDWSFDALKNLSTKLKYGTLAGGVVLTFATSGAGAAVAYNAYSVVSTVDDLLEVLDETIRGINIVNNLRHGEDLINSSREYSIYTTINDIPQFVFFPSSMAGRDSVQDIKYLYPINEGNWWKFSDGRRSSTATVKGTRKVKGKDLVIIKDAGIEVYYGFNGNDLIQHGFNVPGVGDVFFNPGLKWGDDRITLGRKYPFSSNIVTPIDGISGRVQGEFYWHDRQNVKLSDGTPYGDCYASRISYTMELSKGGQTESESFEENRWHAKNVGIVKANIPGFGEGELIEANLNSRMQGFVFPSLSSQGASSQAFIPSMPYRIGEAIKRLRR